MTLRDNATRDVRLAALSYGCNGFCRPAATSENSNARGCAASPERSCLGCDAGCLSRQPELRT